MSQRHLKTDEQIIFWEAPEFIEHEKSIHWYVGFIIISLLLISFAVFSKSIISIIAFLVIILVTFTFAQKKAKIVECTISSTGIAVGKIFYPYKVIRKFWIVYQPPSIKTLNFETTAYLNNIISVELGNQDPIVIKMMLKRYIVEDLDYKESLMDVLARKAKF